MQAAFYCRGWTCLGIRFLRRCLSTYVGRLHACIMNGRENRTRLLRSRMSADRHPTGTCWMFSRVVPATSGGGMYRGGGTEWTGYPPHRFRQTDSNGRTGPWRSISGQAVGGTGSDFLLFVCMPGQNLYTHREIDTAGTVGCVSACACFCTARIRWNFRI